MSPASAHTASRVVPGKGVLRLGRTQLGAHCLAWGMLRALSERAGEASTWLRSSLESARLQPVELARMVTGWFTGWLLSRARSAAQSCRMMASQSWACSVAAVPPSRALGPSAACPLLPLSVMFPMSTASSGEPRDSGKVQYGIGQSHSLGFFQLSSRTDLELLRIVSMNTTRFYLSPTFSPVVPVSIVPTEALFPGLSPQRYKRIQSVILYIRLFFSVFSSHSATVKEN